MRTFDLEDRLIEFSVQIINILDFVKPNKAGNHLSGQLVRSGTSPALNYGEAQAAESKRDFIHKMKIILKELRESFICLKIIEKASLCSEESSLDALQKENNELISIFVKSIETAKRNIKS